ncbi:MAG: Arc family DNA-binding protein [Geminicoccaceae bacterium]
MAQLHVRNVPDDIVAALKSRAASSGRSMEAELRRILEEALRPAYTKKRMLEALQGLAWDDPDFRPERSRDTGRPVDL